MDDITDFNAKIWLIIRLAVESTLLQKPYLAHPVSKYGWADPNNYQSNLTDLATKHLMNLIEILSLTWQKYAKWTGPEVTWESEDESSFSQSCKTNLCLINNNKQFILHCK